MFWKMLKSELKHNKGLNAVLLIFMITASVLVFAGAVQIHSYFTGYERTVKQCASSDFKMIIDSRRSRIGSRRDAANEVFGQSEYIRSFSRLEMTEFYNTQIDFDGIDEQKTPAFSDKSHYLTTMPKESDLVFDLDDQPFTVPDGCAALPVALKSITGAKVGDTFRITTEMGYIYELTVCGFFKDQLDYRMRYIVSDADYAVISAECYTVTDLYSLFLNPDAPGVYDYTAVSEKLETALKEKDVSPRSAYFGNMTDESVMTMIVSVFVLLISIFMILIILMTIRFTIIASLKEEEKEIGMMRAMGIESLGFRWLFTAKYIGFTLLGSIAGLLLGIPVSRLLFRLFSQNTTLPPTGTMLLIGSLSVLAIAAVMILFSLGVMRRINKISVIDAIHGENRGERFGKSAALYLFRRPKMPVPLYLALSDILKRAKRYLFLLISYTLGISILLIIFNLRNTVISERFMCYSSCYAVDFAVNPDESLLNSLYKRCVAARKSVHEIMNDDFATAGIPAEIDVVRCNYAKLHSGEYEIPIEMLISETHPERYTYRKGGCAPKLENEVAMSYYTAKQRGFQVGDTVTFSLFENAGDNMSGEYRDKQLVITGFIDAIEDAGGSAFAMMGNDYKDGFATHKSALSMVILTDESEKPAVIQQIRDLYPTAQVLDGKQNAQRYLSEYDRIFALLEYIMGGTVIFVTVLMTYLYMNIFLAEETREIALMKSMGFADGSLRAWQILRLLILTAAAAVIAVILVRTAGSLFIRKLFELLELTGFRFLPEYPVSCFIIPAGALITVCAAALIRLTGLGNISIKQINEE